MVSPDEGVQNKIYKHLFLTIGSGRPLWDTCSKRLGPISLPLLLLFSDRTQLTDLSRCGWESLKAYFTSSLRQSDTV